MNTTTVEALMQTIERNREEEREMLKSRPPLGDVPDDNGWFLRVRDLVYRRHVLEERLDALLPV